MQKTLLYTAVLMLAACGGEDLSPEQKEARAQEAVKLFAESCVAHRGEPAQVAAWAGTRNAQALTADDVKKLPFGMMELDWNAVWRLEKNQAAYYLSLAPESCSVKTEKADENTVRRQFMQLVGQVPQGMNQELRSDKSTQTPFPFRQLSYAWRAQGSPEEWVLTANTSPSDQLPAQAALYFTHQVYHSKPVFNQTN
ncbi:NMCC_0638 family (lipo)protein [Neisseria sp. CCUG12390]|uniref:NMCC_0638 family (lipo)protein n=1 Tax=Neisseria sp. CCUG12390 TaxID=3392035 RepID=UPI003A1016A4